MTLIGRRAERREQDTSLESDQVPLARDGGDGLQDGAEVAVVGDADDLAAAVVFGDKGDDGVVCLPARDGIAAGWSV